MPTYEYACTSCDNHMEVAQGFSEKPLEVCGICGGKLRRVFHPVGVLFKGSGFYSTDSRSKKAKSDVTPKSDGKKPSSEPKSGGGSERKATSEKAS